MDQLIQQALAQQLALWVEGDELALSFAGAEPAADLLSHLSGAKASLLKYLGEQQVFSEQDFIARFAPAALQSSQTGSQTGSPSNMDAMDAVEAVFAANSLQQGFVFHHLTQPDDDAYLIQLLLDHQTPLQLDCYIKAWQLAARCFPALRLSFDWDSDGEVLQIVSRHSVLAAEHFRLVDLSALSRAEQDAVIERERLLDRQQPFDLRHSGLLRFVVFQLGSRGTTVLKTDHHAITDGWSGTVLLQKVYQCYGALCAAEPIPPAWLATDEAYLEAQQYYSAALPASQQFWQQQRAGFASANDLSAMLDQAPAGVLATMRRVQQNAELALTLSPTLTRALRQQCRQLGVTLNTAVQCSWHKLVQLYSGDQQSLVGTTVSGRDLPIDGVAQSVGLYINTLPLALDWPVEASLADQLLALQQQNALLNSHSNVSLASLQPGGSRLFHSLLIYENYPPANQAMAQAGISVRQSVEKMDYPLVLLAFEQQSRPDLGSSDSGSPDLSSADPVLSVQLKYDATLCSEVQAQRLLLQLQQVLQAIALDPEVLHQDLALCSDADRQWLAQAGRGATLADEMANQTLAQRFAAQALATPAALALKACDASLTYQQLAGQVWQLAQALQAQQVKAGQRVAVCLARHSQLVVSLLALQQLGAAYLPLDPAYPAPRLADMLADGQPSLVLTEAASLALLTEAAALAASESAASSTIPLLEVKALLATKAHAVPNPITCLQQQAAADRQALAYLIYTSGSTGKPKGVQVAQAQVSTFISAMQQLFRPLNSGHLLAVTSVCFDIHVLELFLPLLSGGCVVLASTEQARDPAQLIPLLDADVTMMQATPATWKMLLATRWQPTGPICLLTGGEALSQQLAKQLLALPQVRLWNMYGPTETTVWSCASEISRSEVAQGAAICIGGPIAQTRLLVLSDRGQLLPPGVAGELWIGGAGVSPGYWQKPTETAARFTELAIAAELFGKDAGRFYRTGDLVRWQLAATGDARLVVLGRLDQQVKLRGYRIELADIEQQLLALPAVADAVVVLQQKAQADAQLVAYVVWRTEPVADLLTQLAGLLPAYMVPSVLVELPALPLTLNGKVDRKALPAAELSSKSTVVAAKTALQQQLVEIWQRLFQVSPIGITDNFFALGGHSVLAIQLLSAIQQETDLTLSLNQLLATPTIAALTEAATETTSSETTATDSTSTETAAALVTMASSDTSTSSRPLLSFAQERMLFIEQFDEGQANYQLPLVARLAADADTQLLQQALQLLMVRHSQLRTQYHRDEQGQYYPVELAEQAVFEQAASACSLGQRAASLTDDDAADLGANYQYGSDSFVSESVAIESCCSEAQLRQRLQQLIATPFDLSTQVPWRWRYLELSGERYLLLVWHHIAVDGWSVGVLLSELGPLYQLLSEQPELSAALRQPARALAVAQQLLAQSTLAPLPMRYSDYARWQRQLDLTESLRYWQQRLAGHQQLELPLTYQRPLQASLLGRNRSFSITPALTDALQQLARAEHTSLYTVLLSGFALALAQLSGQQDVLIGTVSDGRHLPPTQSLVGLFVNTLVLRLQLEAANDAPALVRHAHQRVLEARQHQSLPFEQLLQSLQLSRDPSRHPLFQVMFSYEQQAQSAGVPAAAPLQLMTGADLYSPAKFDLDLAVTPAPAGLTAGGLTANLTYAVSLFSEAQAARIAGYYVRALEALVSQPALPLSDISLLSAAEHQALTLWQQGPLLRSELPQSSAAAAIKPAPVTLVSLFNAMAKAQPQACALVWYLEDDAQNQHRQNQHSQNHEQQGDTDQATELRANYQRVQWSYQQLAQQVEQLSLAIRVLYQQHYQRPLAADTLVAIYLPRGGAQICAQLAVQAAGAAYLPLSLEYPPERLAFVLADSAAALVLSAAQVKTPLMAALALLPAANQSLPVLWLATDNAQTVLAEPELINNPLADLLADPLADTVQPIEQSTEPATVQPTDLAYVIYTSGTTGTPKGVLTEHQAIVDRLAGWQQYYLDQQDSQLRLLSMADPAFDVALADWVRALCTGGCLVLCDKATALEPAELLWLCQTEQISFADFVPVLLRQLLDHLAQQKANSTALPALRQLVVGGDTWTLADQQKTLALLGPAVTLYNSYGLTECAVDSTIAAVGQKATGKLLTENAQLAQNGPVENGPAEHALPAEKTLQQSSSSVIGRPLPGVSVYLLDTALKQVPPGTIGELYVGGAGLARGYLQRPELTDSRFLLDPYAAPAARDRGWQRMYKTGDLARWRPDGQLEYLGRNDFQVKIRGHRIELTDIEQALLQIPAVVQAAVIDIMQQGHKSLAAYLVLKANERFDPQALARDLARRLPAPMLPASYSVLAALPLSSNGKLDRSRLPAPQFQAQAAYQAASTPLAQQLASLWLQVLGPVFPHGQPGLEDNFFVFGGDSVKALQLVNLARGQGLAVTTRLLFECQTIAALEKALAAVAATPATAEPKLATPLSADELAAKISTVGCLPALPADVFVDISLPKAAFQPLLTGHGGVSALAFEPNQPWQQPAEASPRLYFIAPAGAGAECYLQLLQQLPAHWSLLLCENIERALGGSYAMPDLAAYYSALIAADAPTAPVVLFGASHGAIVAHDVALRLPSLGVSVAGLALLDPIGYTLSASVEQQLLADPQLWQLPADERRHFDALLHQLRYSRALAPYPSSALVFQSSGLTADRTQWQQADQLLFAHYDFFVGREAPPKLSYGLAAYLPNAKAVLLRGDHGQMFASDNLQLIGQTLTRYLDRDLAHELTHDLSRELEPAVEQDSASPSVNPSTITQETL